MAITVKPEKNGSRRREPGMSAYAATAEAGHGVVTLRGIVDRSFLKSCAIAGRAPGVIDDDDKFAIRAPIDFGRPTLHPQL